MKNYLRIVIEDKSSYLTYNRGRIDATVVIERARLRYGLYVGGLVQALRYLREEIQSQREKLRQGDKLAEKPTCAVLQLLRQKRERYADTCLYSKKPITRAKHIGVEIEFCSSDSRRTIAKSLAAAGLHSFVELKQDGSVQGDGDNGECTGDCRENCECTYCGETHYCDNERECARESRRGGDFGWEFREDCTDCTVTDTLDECNCGGTNEAGENVCKGDHIVCQGHCTGHNCHGEHEFDCECECTCSPEEGHELAIVATAKAMPEVIRKVCAVLEEHDAYVNKTCGLHVHLDAREQDEKRMFGNLVKSQNLLYSMVPVSRHKNNYCRPNDCGLLMTKYQGRYWGINPASYTEHKTIEVRLHSGTVNAAKIINWVSLLSRIAYAKRIRPVRNLVDLTATVKIPESLLAYVNARLMKFASGHSGEYAVRAISDSNQSIQNEMSEVA